MHLYRKSIFRTRARVIFDPSNDDHVRDYAKFVKNSNWVDGCNYLLEDPFLDIPTMINTKLVSHLLVKYQ